MDELKTKPFSSFRVGQLSGLFDPETFLKGIPEGELKTIRAIMKGGEAPDETWVPVPLPDMAEADMVCLEHAEIMPDFNTIKAGEKSAPKRKRLPSPSDSEEKVIEVIMAVGKRPKSKVDTTEEEEEELSPHSSRKLLNQGP
jgi:hypothetical protein